jgi:hypothetical protein
VTLGRNLGTEVEILSGLSPSDRVINSPPDSLGAGDKVRIAGQQPNSGNSGNAESSRSEDVASDPRSKQH